MAPKSKKAIDEPPANSTRAKTSPGDAKSKSSRKQATDFFDGEIGETAEEVVPRAKVQKEKTAKQSAEVEAESKPHHMDEASGATKPSRAKAGTDDAKPKATRKRAVELFDGEIGEHADEVVPRAKVQKQKTAKQGASVEAAGKPHNEDGDASVATEPATKAKAKEGKASKDDVAKGDDTSKSTATGKSKGKAAKVDKPAEATQPAKGKKGKAPKETPAEPTAMDDPIGAVEEEPAEEPAKPKAKRGRPRKSEVKEDESRAQAKPAETEKTHPGGDRVEVEPAKPTKGQKGKKAAAKPESEPSAPKGKSKASKKAGDKDDSSDPEDDAPKPSTTEPTKSTKKASKAAEAKPAKQTATGKDKPAKSAGKAGKAEQAAGSEPQKKGKKAKAASSDAKDDTDGADIAPDMAMDDSVFESRLGTDKGKEPVDDEAANAEKSKPKKAAKNASKDQDSNDTTAKAKAKSAKKAKEAPETADDANPSATKSKKRKTPADHDADAVKADVLDPLAESASAKKKQKKTQPGALGAVGSLLGATVDSAKKKAKAVIDYAGDIAGSAQKSITDDIVDVAEGAVQEQKKKAKQSAKASEPAATNGDAPEDEDDDDTFFSDTGYLKGFESDGDENDGEDVDFPTDPEKSIPKIPSRAQTKAKNIASSSSSSVPGYIYVGRIPHGFYEHQMRAYFSQFGHITNLRLSRNKTTGHSKHFAFLEFENEEVAKIVAATMDNYLLFGHILKVKLIPKGELHPDTFKGANKRFTSVPWAQIKGRELALPVSREHWEKRVSKEAEKRKTKAEKMKEIGYELEAPLKGVDTVPVKKGKGKEAIDEGKGVVVEEDTLITAEKEDGSMIVTEVTKVKKVKGKGKEVVSEATAVVKKGKRKAEEGVDGGKNAVGDAVEPVAKKVRKGKDMAVEGAKKGAEKVAKGK